MRQLMFGFVAAIAVVGAAGAASAKDYTITLKDHVFSPKELNVAANKKFKLTVVNDDATPAEFESSDLSREKVVQGKSKAIILLGPLKAGTYKFVDEFHEKTASGTIIAK